MATASRGFALCVVLALGLGACTQPPADIGRDEGQLQIAVAPLSLPGVTNARYTLTVTNGADGTGDQVWSQTLEADDFGDGAGSVSFVGPCDASTGTNSLTLVLDDLFEGAGVPISPAVYENPTPLTRNVTCQANEDTQVPFNIVIVREATQGFFDVAVSFEDVFCSAKLDCVRNGGTDPLQLLHHPVSGEREQTAVLGLACTGSPTGDTFLYMDDPVISCTGLAANVTFAAAGLGKVDMAANTTQNAGGYLFGAAIYRGNEELAAKSFWNISFGLDEDVYAAAGNCTLISRATASSTQFAAVDGGFSLPPSTIYPVIDFDVPLTNAAGRVCGAHGLNSGDGRVQTSYVGFAPTLFVFGSEPIIIDNRYTRATQQVDGPSCGAAGNDCDGVCEPLETGADCDGVCGLGEGGSDDCDAACDVGESAGPDCDGACDASDENPGPDCSAANLGESANNPGESCLDIFDARGLPLADTTYFIDPGGGVFEAYCDMNSDGGGWTLLAVLNSTDSGGTGNWPSWTAAWWTVSHGTPTQPTVAFSNHDMRLFRPLVSATSVVRASSPAAAVSRYHFNMTQSDWDLWNTTRTESGVRIVGPFDAPTATQVSTSPALTGAGTARVNGHWDSGYFYLGTAISGGDSSGDVGARYHVATNNPGTFGYVGDVQQDAIWHLWLK